MQLRISKSSPAVPLKTMLAPMRLSLIHIFAGGFSFSGELGGIKGYENLKTQCETLGIPLFVDFDLLYFNQGGNGFGTLFDTAKSAMGQRATFYKLTKALHKEDTEAPPYFLLSRKKLTQASECCLLYTSRCV